MGGLDAMKVLTTFLLFATTLPAFGNSFDVYAVQFDQPAIVYLDPNGNTILHESYPLNPILGFTPILTFGFIQPLGSTFTWTISLTLAGLAYAPQSGTYTCDPQITPCTNGGSWYTPFLTPVPGIVTVTVNGETETFHFQYSVFETPAPEPTTLLLVRA